ncbi:MAG: dihydrofolate reductase family protein [Polyangiales bacterium]
MEIIWYTAMSMDGRIASSDASLGFLETIDKSDEAERDFPAFLATIDAVIIGGATMRWLVDAGHGWPHQDLPTWLVSRDAALVERIGPTQATLRRVEGPLAPVVSELQASGAKRVWCCGGGEIAAQLLAIDRIDEVIATIAPVALGAGPGLFGARPLAEQPLFSLEECRPFAGNAVRARWRRARAQTSR